MRAFAFLSVTKDDTDPREVHHDVLHEEAPALLVLEGNLTGGKRLELVVPILGDAREQAATKTVLEDAGSRPWGTGTCQGCWRYVWLN